MQIALLLTALLSPVRCASISQRRSKRIAGGKPVTSYKYPWMVEIATSYEEITTDPQPYYTTNECSGSFIDVYGTVLTAAHCVSQRYKEVITIKDNQTGKMVVVSITEFKIRSVTVTWGYYALKVGGAEAERFRKLERIVYHQDAYALHQDQNRTDIDLALVYVNWFKRNRMNCSRRSKVKPIQLTRTIKEFYDPGDGILAGFGCYPITDDNLHIIGDGPTGENLMEVGINYRDRVRSVEVELEPTMFFGYSKIGKEAPYNITSKLRFSGLCDSDSGGPYMVKAYTGGPFLLRGVATSSPGVEGEKWSRAFSPIYFADVNYPSVRKWIINALTARYEALEIAGYDTIPITC